MSAGRTWAYGAENAEVASSSSCQQILLQGNDARQDALFSEPTPRLTVLQLHKGRTGLRETKRYGAFQPSCRRWGCCRTRAGSTARRRSRTEGQPWRLRHEPSVRRGTRARRGSGSPTLKPAAARYFPPPPPAGHAPPAPAVGAQPGAGRVAAAARHSPQAGEGPSGRLSSQSGHRWAATHRPDRAAASGLGPARHGRR